MVYKCLWFPDIKLITNDLSFNQKQTFYEMWWQNTNGRAQVILDFLYQLLQHMRRTTAFISECWCCCQVTPSAKTTIVLEVEILSLVCAMAEHIWCHNHATHFWHGRTELLSAVTKTIKCTSCEEPPVITNTLHGIVYHRITTQRLVLINHTSQTFVQLFPPA